MRMRLVMTSVFVAVLCVCTAAPAQDETFQVLGIGGAGGMYTPTASPYDSGLMLISCDMSGSYRSTDGGKTWEVIHWSEMRTSNKCRPCFFKNGILWASGSTLKISRDKAVTWKPLVTGDVPWKRERITHLAAASLGPGVFFVGTASGLWRSADGGKTWQSTLRGKCFGVIVLGNEAYALSGKTLHGSSDRGATWKALPVPAAKGHTMNSLAGGRGEDGRTVLYATAFGVGVLQSRDKGKTWRVSQGWIPAHNDQNDILMAANQTDVAYVSQSGHRGARKVWRTLDGGRSWENTFRMRGDDANVERSWVQTDISWGYYITPLGLGINPGDPKTVLVSTQGDFYISKDSGTTWKQAMNVKVGVQPGDPGFRYRCNGLEVTTNWKYLFDPFDDRKTYIAYTDIGFARSPDRGKTWIWSARGCPWSNTFYHVVFDPRVRGRMYAATAARHDIPYWGHVSPGKSRGGVCVSDDHAVKWRVLGRGQPVAACTWLCIDPKSPKDRLTFYATYYEEGVFKSSDGGKTWVRKSKGLGHPGNMHAFMVEVHPKTGDVYCSITATRHGGKFPVPGGMWKSTDGGDNWQSINGGLKLGWPCGFALDPRDANVVYLTAATIPGSREGGLYKTTDGGRNWKRILKDEDFAATGGAGFVHANFVDLHPDNPDLVYVGSNTHGLWVSRDGGKTWKRFMKLPFGAAAKVTFDPKDRKIMYVATHGGGVWRGHYLP